MTTIIHCRTYNMQVTANENRSYTHTHELIQKNSCYTHELQ